MESSQFINKLKQEVANAGSINGRSTTEINKSIDLTSNESGTSNSSTFISKLKQEVANTPKVNYVPTTVTTNKEPTLLEKLGFYKIGDAPKSTNDGGLINAITNNKVLDYTNLLGVSAAQGTKDAVANIGTAVGNYSSAALDAINQDKASEKVDDVVQNIYNWQNKENESYQNEVSNHDVNTLGKVGIDVASGVGGMVPSIATSLLTGGSGTFVPLFLSASGGKMKEVYDTVGNNEDSTRAKALLAGTLSGGVEIATEKLFGFTKLFGGTLELDDYLSKYLTKNVTNEVSKVLIDTMIGMAGEGTEELISEYADAFITKIYNDNGESFLQTIVNTSPDAFYSFLIGGLTAGVMESVNIVNDTRNAITTEQQKKNVLKDSLDKAAVEATQSFEQTVTNNQQNVNAEQQTNINNVVDAENQNNAEMASNGPIINYSNISNQDTLNIKKLASRSNTNVEWVDTDSNINGYYKDGTVYLNKNKTSSDNYTTVMVHELTHHIENSGFYNSLSQLVKSDLISKNYNYDELCQNIFKEYSETIPDFTMDDAKREVIAKYSEEFLFTDQETIDKLVRTDRNIAQKIYDWIKDTIQYVRSTKQKRLLKKAESLYAKALDDAVVKNTNKTSFSLSDQEKLENYNRIINSPNVVQFADGTFGYKTNIDFSVRNIKKEDITDYIERNFAGKTFVTVDGDEIHVRKRNVGEFVDGSYSKGKPTVAKSNVSMYIPEAIETSTYKNQMTLNHSTKMSNDLAPDGFIYREACIIDKNGNEYTMSINVGVNNDINSPYYGHNFYDITRVKKRTSPSPQATKSSDYNASLSTNSISQNSNMSTGNSNSTGDHSIGGGISMYDTNNRNLSEEQQNYFKDSKVRDENGNLKTVYHGTKRADRVGNYFDPNKATSGPMAFFTDNRSIAENYSKTKKDTSLSREYDTEYDLFTVNGKNLDDYWNSLSYSKKQAINRAGENVGFDDDFENIVHASNASNNSFGGQYQYVLKNECGNNGIKALYQIFVEDGNLMGEDIVKFKEVLEMVGVDADYLDIYKVDEKVYDTYLNITNPFVTSDISEDIIQQLHEASKKATIGEQYSADLWDKSNITPQNWIEKFDDDIKNGTTYAWTVIPDWVTNVLKNNGYDGIQDTGGKQGGESHTVYIPFYSNQIKNVDNYNPTENVDIRYSRGGKLADYTNERFNQKENETSKTNTNFKEPGNKYVNKTEKVKKYEKAAKNKLIQYLADEFHISRYQVKNLVGDFIDLATDQIQSNNKVDSIIMKDIFNKLADNSYTVDDELRNNYKYLIDDLKNTTFQLNDDTRNGMSEPELKLFKKQNRGKFNIGDTGIPVDVKYQELSSMYPELFPSDISSGDMLNQISEVLDSFDEKYTRNSDILNNDPIMKEASMMDFNNKYNDFLNSMRNAQNVASEIAAKKELKDSFDYNFYKEQEEKIAKLEREYTKVNNKTVLDAKGKYFLDGLMNGVITVDDVDPEYRNDVLSMYKVKKPYEDAKNVIKTYRNVYKEGLRERARGLISGIETWQVQKKINGLAFELDTAERNIRDIAGADAEDIINEYFAPVHKNEAEANKFKNRIRKRIKELNLTKEEAEAVQLLGERADINGREYNESDVVEAGLDLEKVTNAVNEFRSIYNELHNQVNEVLVRNGYNPIEFRKDYFPHFIDQEPDTKLGKALKKMGINVAENNLNADISGLTEYFRPGKSFFGNALHRKTNKTAYNAVEGADRYIEGIANLIYHTDDIQRLRALDTEIRYQTSDEGFKKRIDEIYDDDSISEEERQEKLQNEYQKQGIITRFGNLTTWLTNYTNNLANKKSAADRQMEYDLGRGVYTISKELEGRVAANMVAANASSAMSNFIPITQALGECSIPDIYSAMVDTMNNYFTNDGFMEESVFLTNRVGSDRLSKTTLQQLSDNASIAFTLIDDFVSNTVTRAKYKGNIRKGMSHEEALSNADSYAASLMADRSKGSVPLVFERKNPLAKLFTMFQLEQNNQIRYLLKDLPRNKKDEAAISLLLGIMGMVVGAWCFNEINERLFGRRSALDPLDMAFSTWETATGKGKTSEKITTIAKDFAEEIPFVGGLLGGGRIPISSALPDLSEAVKLFDSNTTNEKRVDIVFNDIIKPLSFVATPFGAGQAWKSLEGGKAVHDGGVYNVTNEGKELKYPVEQNLQNLIKGLIGGKSSFKEAVDYYDKGYYKLSAKTRTKAYGAEDYGMSIDEYLKLYDEVKAITSLKDKDGDPVANSSSILKRKEIDEYTTDKKLRQYLYDCYGVSETVQNYTDNELFLAQRKLHEYYKYNK